ncbi:hypothetical protein OQA88_10695 [Cercophora sp. LCS_1]
MDNVLPPYPLSEVDIGTTGGTDHNPGDFVARFEMPFWAEKQRLFWNMYTKERHNFHREPPSRDDWHLIPDLYQLWHHTSQPVGKHYHPRLFHVPSWPSRKRAETHITRKGLLQFELLARLVMKPYYLCVIDYTEAHHERYGSCSINSRYFRRILEHVLRPKDFFADLPSEEVCDIARVTNFMQAVYEDYRESLNSRIIEDAARFPRSDDPLDAEPSLYLDEGHCMKTDLCLNANRLSHDRRNRIVARELAIDINITQLMGLGIRFFNRLGKIKDDIRGHARMIEASSALNIYRRASISDCPNSLTLPVKYDLALELDHFLRFRNVPGWEKVSMVPGPWCGLSLPVGETTNFERFIKDKVSRRGVEELMKAYGMPVYQDEAFCFNRKRVECILELLAAEMR